MTDSCCPTSNQHGSTAARGYNTLLLTGIGRRDGAAWSRSPTPLLLLLLLLWSTTAATAAATVVAWRRPSFGVQFLVGARRLVHDAIYREGILQFEDLASAARRTSGATVPLLWRAAAKVGVAAATSLLLRTSTIVVAVVAAVIIVGPNRGSSVAILVAAVLGIAFRRGTAARDSNGVASAVKLYSVIIVMMRKMEWNKCISIYWLESLLEKGK